MPWYTKPGIICKVLNRIADRYPVSTISDMRAAVDAVIEMIWKKREEFYAALEHKH